VETFLPAYSFREYVDHQLRWARSVRSSRTWGYTGLILTFGLLWATLSLLAARGAVWAWWLFAATVVTRVAVGLATAIAVLDDSQPFRDAFLVPVRDLIAPLIWAAGLVGNRIFWRGDEFYLKNGRLEKINDVTAGQQESPRLSRP
jgi:ceramide glucosyltransferase